MEARGSCSATTTTNWGACEVKGCSFAHNNIFRCTKARVSYSATRAPVEGPMPEQEGNRCCNVWSCSLSWTRVGQNRIYLYTVYMVISLPKILYTNRIYKVGQNRIYTPCIWWFPCQKYCIQTVCIGLARTVYIHRIYGDFPAKNTVYKPYI